MLQFRSLLPGLILIVALTLGFLAWAVARGSDAAGPRVLRVATWNMQWLVGPDTALAARLACRDGGRSPLPCDVVRTAGRDSADLARLAALVRRLDADVIAFQEVESPAIARQVFSGYRICIAPGAGVQHVGFAVRAALAARCETPLWSVASDGRGRVAQPLTLTGLAGAPIELLAVHLKSGCANDPLDSTTAACRLLTRQAQALGEWIEERARAGASFVVLGDLNRAGHPQPDDGFWSLLRAHRFESSAARLPFRNCVFGAPYSEFIDHILVSQPLLPRLHGHGFEQMRFEPGEASRYQLSDHCPVSVLISTPDSL
jgi:endonuclease/exonuclease/phosphatase family metal-dependent hydrolase